MTNVHNKQTRNKSHFPHSVDKQRIAITKPAKKASILLKKYLTIDRDAPYPYQLTPSRIIVSKKKGELAASSPFFLS